MLLLLHLLASGRWVREVVAHVSIPADLSTVLRRSRLPFRLGIIDTAARGIGATAVWLPLSGNCSRDFALILILRNSWLFDLVRCDGLPWRQTCRCRHTSTRNDALLS